MYSTCIPHVFHRIPLHIAVFNDTLLGDLLYINIMHNAAAGGLLGACNLPAKPAKQLSHQVPSFANPLIVCESAEKSVRFNRIVLRGADRR